MIAWILSVLTAISILVVIVALTYLSPEAVGIAVVVIVMVTILKLTIFTD
jgi:hypothetical protein